MARYDRLLLVDCGAQAMDLLAARVRRLGFETIRAKTPEEAHQALLDPRYAIGAALIPPDLPVFDLTGAIRAMRKLRTHPPLRIVVAGVRPGPGDCTELTDAGVDVAVWEPTDAHTLRFQLNRALSDGLESARRQRRALRGPAAWPVKIRQGKRSREARVYTISATGAFLATPRPALRGAELELDLPLPTGALRAEARVVMTNVPGNLMTARLPAGMGVRFENPSLELEAVLQVYAEERLRSLEL